MTKAEDQASAPETEPLGDGLGVSFAELVLSIATNAMLHLGGDDEEARVKGRVHLPTAAQHIDILAMLRTKTEGNLVEDERTLLEAVLYDLRMRYLEVAREAEHESGG